MGERSAHARPVLCLVTDRHLGGTDLPRRVEAAVAGGVDWVQVRERELDGAALLAHVEAIGAAARRARPDVRLLVNRRLDVAWAAGAAGVHLGGDAIAPEDARRLLGDAALVGASCHAPEEVDAAGPALSYVHLAPVFAPLSKASSRPPLGLGALGRACHPGLPVLAQGGIDAARAAACVAAGAAGVAVTGALLAAGDPRRAAASLREALDR